MKILDSSWPANTIKFSLLSSFKNGVYGIEVEETTGFLKSKKYTYEKENIISIGVIDEDVEKKKSFVGSAVGAGLGGFVLGPIGLLAGALAGGNKTSKIIKIGIKFNDKNWILAEYNTKSTIDKLELFSIQKIELKGKKEAPF